MGEEAGGDVTVARSDSTAPGETMAADRPNAAALGAFPQRGYVPVQAGPCHVSSSPA